MRKNKVAVLLLASGLFLNFGVNGTANANMYASQQQAIRNMQNNAANKQQMENMMRDYESARQVFETEKNSNTRDAVNEKANLDARFAKMKEEFANSGVSQPTNKVKEQPDLDMSIPNGQSVNAARPQNTGNNNKANNVGSNYDLNDTEMNYIRRNPTTKGYIDTGNEKTEEDREYNRNIARVIGESQLDDSNHVKDETFKNRASNTNTFTKDNVEKFTLATIFLFVVMAILFFLGKRK